MRVSTVSRALDAIDGNWLSIRGLCMCDFVRWVSILMLMWLEEGTNAVFVQD